MLRKNPLNPPRPFRSAVPVTAAAGPAAGPFLATRPQQEGPGFLSAEAFDATEILRGVDPAEPNYWWMPELYGPDLSGGTSADTAPGAAQAAARSADKTAA